MLGHKWEKVAATIVGVQGGGPAPAPGTGPSMAAQVLREYVIEVRKPNGETLRTTVSETSRFVHSVGSPMHVEVNFKTGEAKIDPHAMAKMAREMLLNRPSAAAGIAGGSAGMAGGMAGLAGLVSAIGAASSTMQSVHVIGPNGQEIPVSGLQRADLSGLAQAMMAGDPAARQAAIAQLRQMRAQLSQQAAAADAGYSAPGSTFDPIGPAETFSGPVTDALPGQPAGPDSFPQFSSPGQYGQVSPPASFGMPSAFGSLPGGGTGENSVEQRLAKLQQLLDKGILTESEYQAKRQQVINEI